jgi:hypothetical protein
VVDIVYGGTGAVARGAVEGGGGAGCHGIRGKAKSVG